MPDTGYTTLQALNTSGTEGVVGFGYVGPAPYPTTPAYDPRSENMYISDTGNDSVAVMSSTCADGYGPNGPGPLYCFSLSPTVTNQTINSSDISGLPSALGNHTYVIQIDSLFLSTGQWKATSASQFTSASSSGKISFQATGPNGTVGYATITIPKVLAGLLLYAELGTGATANPSQLRATPTLLIDGIPTPVFFWQADSVNFYLTFRVHFSTHEITIEFTPLASFYGIGTSSSISSTTTENGFTTSQEGASSLLGSSSAMTSSSSSSTTSFLQSSSSSHSSSSSSYSLQSAYLIITTVIVITFLMIGLLKRRKENVGK